MSAPATAPTGGDKNRATELLAVTWAEFTVSLALVALRFFTRLRITHNLWYDDWVILFTLASFPWPIWFYLRAPAEAYS